MRSIPKAAIYCRLSIEDRNKAGNDDSQSIQNQKAMLNDFCRGHGWEIYGIYVDDGYSGIDRSRPEFNRLLRDCEDGHIDIVVCKDQSRFSRDTVVTETYLNDRFIEWGVRFIGVTDNADTDSESYGTMRLFTSAYNEMYVRDISTKIRRTLSHKRKAGQFIGSFAPYGYCIDPSDRHHLIIDPDAAPVVRKIFDMYICGNGYRGIVQWLNCEGIPNPSEYKRMKGSRYVNANEETSGSKGLWTQPTVARILANEIYTGTLVQGKSHSLSYKNKKRRKVDQSEWIRIPGAHEAVIDTETWERTQQRFSSHSRVGSGSQELSPLSGKVRCAECKKPMKRNVYYNKSRTVRYYGLQCASYKTGAMNCPNRKSISGLVLEKIILGELNSLAGKYCQADDIRIMDIHSERITELEEKLSALRERQNSAKVRLVKMYKEKLDGIISDDDYTLFRKSLSDDEDKLTEQIQETEMQLDKCLQREDTSEGQNDIIGKYLHLETLDRAAADEFIDFIEIGMEDGNGVREISIHWKL